MRRSPEMGFNPNEGKEEPKDKKPERKIIIKKKADIENEKKPLNIKYEDFKEVNETLKDGLTDKQWEREMKAAVELKKMEKMTEQERAREEAKKLFGDKE